MRHLAPITLLVLALVTASPAPAAHDADDHSENTALVSSTRLGGLGDLAFWGDLAVASQFTFDNGSTDGFSVMDISDPARPRQIRRFVCSGAGWDVSMWRDLVFLSVDNITPSLDGTCESVPGSGFQGIKIVSIADPAHPVGVGSVPMPCSGSHNNTVLHDPARNRVLLYTGSVGLTEREQTGCDAVISVPLDEPGDAEVIAPMAGGEAGSCHEFAVHVERKLLAGACLTELRIYDIADPQAPRLLSAFVNPAQTFNHSVGFSNDGGVLVSGEETAQSSGLTGGCTGGTPSPHGALWFYDVADPAVPKLRSYHQVAHGRELMSPGGAGCSVHNFSVVPTRGERDVLSAGWYGGGMSLVDFTDPAAPAEVAHYLPDQRDPERRAHYWAAYWYRGHVYASNTFETERAGLDVYAVAGIGDTFRLPHLNPQTQGPLADAPSAASAAGDVDGPAAPGGPAGKPPSRKDASPRCRPGPRRLMAPGRVLRASIRGRRLRVRGRVVRVNLRGLRPGRHRVSIRYRAPSGRSRTLIRRVRAC